MICGGGDLVPRTWSSHVTGAQRVHSPLPSRVMQPSGPRGCTGPMPVFYKKFLCFLQNYGMILLDNACERMKDYVSWFPCPV